MNDLIIRKATNNDSNGKGYVLLIIIDENHEDRFESLENYKNISNLLFI